MQELLPGYLCNAAYFRECFDMTKSSCLKKAQALTRECLAKEKPNLPQSLTQQSGAEWGSKVGSCAGAQLEITMLLKKKDDPRCSDASQWIGK